MFKERPPVFGARPDYIDAEASQYAALVDLSNGTSGLMAFADTFRENNYRVVPGLCDAIRRNASALMQVAGAIDGHFPYVMVLGPENHPFTTLTHQVQLAYLPLVGSNQPMPALPENILHLQRIKEEELDGYGVQTELR